MTQYRIPTFVHIEKTGGTTLIYTLRRNFPFGHCDIIPRSKTANSIDAADLTNAFRIHLPLRSLAGHSIHPYRSLGQYDEQLAMYTLLRNGRERYISEYHHDCIKRGFHDGFAEWLKYEERWNWQTKSICGSDDLEQAKEILDRRFAFVGVLEHYAEFVAGVATLFKPFPVDTHFRPLNQAGLPAGAVDGHSQHVEKISPELLRKADAVNQLDTELYHYALEKLLPAQRKQVDAEKPNVAPRPYHQLTTRLLLRLYSTFRNCVYKPSCGIFPGQVHMLPINKGNVKQYRQLSGLPLPGQFLTDETTYLEENQRPSPSSLLKTRDSKQSSNQAT